MSEREPSGNERHPTEARTAPTPGTPAHGPTFMAQLEQVVRIAADAELARAGQNTADCP